MSALVLVHVLAVGVWLGCLATEIVFEKAAAGDEALRPFLSRLHDRVDRFVEGPAFVVTAASGLALWAGTTTTVLLAVKIAVAVATILLNVWCVRIVFDRDRAAREGRWADWGRIDHLQHKVGGGVAIGLVVATGLGGLRAAGW